MVHFIFKEVELPYSIVLILRIPVNNNVPRFIEIAFKKNNTIIGSSRGFNQ